jgi:hypothetical protein
MFRHVAIFTIALAGIVNLNAGQIMVGGNSGLTSASGTTETTTGSASTAGLQPYNSTLYQGVSSPGYTSGNLCAGATTSTCASTTGYPNGETNNEFLSGNGVTFAMINQTISGVGEGVWAATNTAGTGAVPVTSTITIPIGIFGVTNVETMLNDQFGLASTSDTTVQFVFTNPAFNETFTLMNGTVIRDTYSCTTGTCPTYATGLDTTHMFDINGNSLGLIGATTTANVTAFNLWSGTYTSTAGAYNGTSGNLYLDAQNFYLGSFASNQTLASIVITDTNTAAKQSRIGLSAVTLLATPEPSTIFLIGAGIAGIGLLRRRRSA